MPHEHRFKKISMSIKRKELFRFIEVNTTGQMCECGLYMGFDKDGDTIFVVIIKKKILEE